MPPQNQNKNQSEIDDLIKKTGENIVHPVSPFGEPPEKEYTSNPFLKTLRTFQGDVEETIKDRKTSVSDVFMAEQASKKISEVELPQKKDWKSLIFHIVFPVLGILLFISGAVTLVIIYYNAWSTNTPIKVAVTNSLITYNDKKVVNLSGTDTVDASVRENIIKNLSDEKNSYNKPAGSVLFLQFLSSQNELTSADFFKNIAPTAPATLVRSFGQKYMSGIYSFDTNEIFLIFSSDNYGLTYSGMLKWENSMGIDLSPIFSIIDGSMASGTSAFQDDSFNNQDVRILKNSLNQIVLVYGFMDRETLAITSNEKIFQAITNKYRNSKLVR